VKKWTVTDVLSATGFNRIMVSTIMAPALSTIALELDMNSAESVMALSIYLLATAFGPLLIGPLSEIYGRAPILHFSNVWFLVWNIVCGFAKTKGTLIAARFLAGFGASAIYALAGGVLGDIWRPEQRGKSLGVYLLIPLLGAAIGKAICACVIPLRLTVLTVHRPNHWWLHGSAHNMAVVSPAATR
jgi:MFS family permease